ncbi:extracellular solute-binding protein [Parendozoicomonas haliclonae]|uniref:Putrescine-binding periplasmic protein n=1 Tax=Parendozoicomonas haliclonae TaxID=1960125 RepID=A0A1X7ARD0_9GAMM|nr:extracellular solute-binding protein [Parendozoicomonas haliclonae]SMA50795.1 Putrescine-binding periplasmic protein precursor [Parendozoicomonas haliclonae]
MSRIGAKLKTGLTVLATSCALIPVVSTTALAEERVLNVYNWSDYIAEDTIANFEAKTGIKVVYDVFDSNEVLEAKLLSGKTGYDIVVPSASFMAKQIKAGVFQTLDRSKLPNWKNLDTEIMSTVEGFDPGNQHAIPYLWGTTGLGYNPDLVAKHLGGDVPVDSWDLVFKPEYASKLQECGLTMLNAPTEMMQAALNYLDLDPNSTDKKDYAQAQELLSSVRPHVTYFHSSKLITDLANGDVCISVGWSGDVLQAADRADEADKGITVEYVIPKEGALTWFDMLAIPKDAENVDEAYAFINYLMEDKVMADIQNYVSYASAVKTAEQYVDAEITGNPGIYPTAEAKKNLYISDVLPPKIDRVINRAFTKVTTGK